jgi:hypothetical protein
MFRPRHRSSSGPLILLWTHLYKKAWRWPVYGSKHVAYDLKQYISLPDIPVFYFIRHKEKTNFGPKKWTLHYKQNEILGQRSGFFHSNKSSSHKALSVNNYCPWKIRILEYPARHFDMASVNLAMFRKTQIPTDESHSSVKHSFPTMWRQKHSERNCERSRQVIITSTPHK